MSSSKVALADAWCEVHGKLMYSSRKNARKVARRLDGHKNTYQCSVQPDYFHVGELHPQVIAGERTRNSFTKKAA